MLRAGRWGVLLAMLAVTAAHGAELHVDIKNTYAALIDLGPLGGGNRSGTDALKGTLTEQPDGSWTGEVDATIEMDQELHGLGMTCPMTHFSGKQKLRVQTQPESGWNAASSITFDAAAGPGKRSGKFVSLDVAPAAAASITPTKPCLTMSGVPSSSIDMLPLNDGRWTQPGYGYTIELPESGLLVWTDDTVNPAQSGAMSSFNPATADSHWSVRVERR